MQHDVRRLDRLISDISDASRLDAELARGEASQVDVAALLRTVVSMAQDSPRANGTRIELSIETRRGRHPDADFLVIGHDSRLAQVVTNLIDNACSFPNPAGPSGFRSQGLRRHRKARRRTNGSSSRSTTTAPEFRRMRSNGSSSAFTPIAQVRDSDRIPGSGFRSRDRSSRRTAEGSGRRTVRPRRTAGEVDRRRAARHGPGAIRSRIAGLQSMSSTARLGTGLHATAVIYRRKRRDHPGSVRIGQERAGPRAASPRQNDRSFRRSDRR